MGKIRFTKSDDVAATDDEDDDPERLKDPRCNVCGRQFESADGRNAHFRREHSDI